jgi:phosphatidylglycerol:prolipoprotein diacylglycerol transferase
VLPKLFEIGPITVYSFGLMMGIAFLVANYLFASEIRRRKLPEELAGTVTLIALVGGVIGSKLFSLLENWDRVVEDPMAEIFSASGLTFYGGLIVAIIAIWFYVRSKKVPFMRVADAAAPSLIIAYGIGRIGCQLAGDGDYGIPSKLPWAMPYPKGTVPTNGWQMAADSARHLSELGKLYAKMYPGERVPDQVPVHPAPVYETLAALAIFAFLWAIRKKPRPVGMIFAIYLICAGIERLLVEFIRLNPLYLGLSQAQWISVGMIAIGSYMSFKLRSLPAAEEWVAPKPVRKRIPAGAKAVR